MRVGCAAEGRTVIVRNGAGEDEIELVQALATGLEPVDLGDMQERRDRHLRADFLQALTLQRVLKAFPRLLLAAGQGVVKPLLRVALFLNQKLVVPLDKGARGRTYQGAESGVGFRNGC